MMYLESPSCHQWCQFVKCLYYVARVGNPDLFPRIFQPVWKSNALQQSETFASMSIVPHCSETTDTPIVYLNEMTDPIKRISYITKPLMHLQAQSALNCRRIVQVSTISSPLTARSIARKLRPLTLSLYSTMSCTIETWSWWNEY